jgi:two-component system response regulator NreC
MTPTPIRVLIADDHAILRQGLVALLNGSGECVVVAEAGDGIEAVQHALRLRPDVVVVDLSMPRLNGVEVVRRLKAELPSTRTLVLTMHNEEEYVLHVVRAGASGFLLKDSALGELLAAVRSLHRGQAYFGPYASQVLATQLQHPGVGDGDPYRNLTAREREVFHLVVDGLTTKEIAKRLDIGIKTAENHRARILDKLDVRNTAELVRYAMRKGLLD